jgi:hypothetical protein
MTKKRETELTKRLPSSHLATPPRYLASCLTRSISNGCCSHLTIGDEEEPAATCRPGCRYIWGTGSVRTQAAGTRLWATYLQATPADGCAWRGRSRQRACSGEYGVASGERKELHQVPAARSDRSRRASNLWERQHGRNIIHGASRLRVVEWNSPAVRALLEATFRFLAFACLSPAPSFSFYPRAAGTTRARRSKHTGSIVAAAAAIDAAARTPQLASFPGKG